MERRRWKTDHRQAENQRAYLLTWAGIGVLRQCVCTYRSTHILFSTLAMYVTQKWSVDVLHEVFPWGRKHLRHQLRARLRCSRFLLWFVGGNSSYCEACFDTLINCDAAVGWDCSKLIFSRQTRASCRLRSASVSEVGTHFNQGFIFTLNFDGNHVPK